MRLVLWMFVCYCWKVRSRFCRVRPFAKQRSAQHQIHTKNTYGHISSISCGWRKNLITCCYFPFIYKYILFCFFFVAYLFYCKSAILFRYTGTIVVCISETISIQNCFLLRSFLSSFFPHQVADLLHFFSAIVLYLVEFWITCTSRILWSVQIWMHLYHCVRYYWIFGWNTCVCGSSVLFR